MITTIKKVRPMFNNMVVTLNKYPTDLTTNGGIIDSTRAGSVKEYQTVVAVGPMVRGIEVGDIVYDSSLERRCYKEVIFRSGKLVCISHEKFFPAFFTCDQLYNKGYRLSHLTYLPKQDNHIPEYCGRA